MKKQILEEISRFKLLSVYDMKSTLTENKTTLTERLSPEELVKLEKNLLKTGSKQLAPMKNALEIVLSGPIKFGKFVTKDLKTLNTADDVIKALKAGNVTEQTAARIYWNVFRNTSDQTLLELVAKRMANQESFIKQYGDLSKKDFLTAMKTDFKVDPKQADELYKANFRRITTSEKIGQTTSKATKKAKEIEQTIPQGVQGVNFQVVQNNTNQIMESIDDIARSRKFDNAKHWKSKDPAGYKAFIDGETKRAFKGQGIFSKLIKWGRRTITFSKLLAWAGMGYGLWWLYNELQKIGIDTECDDQPGTHFENGKGCVPNRSGGETGGGQDRPELTDSEGNKYQECIDIYHIGCINKKGNDDIKKAQDCLGLRPDGFFNKEMEDALFKKINKRSFLPSDLPTICAKSYGGGSFQI